MRRASPASFACTALRRAGVCWSTGATNRFLRACVSTRSPRRWPASRRRQTWRARSKRTLPTPSSFRDRAPRSSSRPPCCAAGDARLTLPFPAEMLQGGFRDSLRLPTRPGEGVLVSFPHHRTDGCRRARETQEVSDQGLSFPLAAGQDLLLPGDRLEDLRVELPTGTVSTLAVVRSIAPATAPTVSPAGSSCWTSREPRIAGDGSGTCFRRRTPARWTRAPTSHERPGRCSIPPGTSNSGRVLRIASGSSAGFTFSGDGRRRFRAT